MSALRQVPPPLSENKTPVIFSLPAVSGDANNTADQGWHAKRALSHACKAVWKPHKVQPGITDRNVKTRSHSVSASLWLNLFTSVTSCKYILIYLVKRTHFCSACKVVYLGNFCSSLRVLYVLMMSSCCLVGWARAAVTAASCYNSPKFTVCRHVRACQRTKGWYRHVFPVILRCVCACVLIAVARAPSGPAHISMAQTGAADWHAETCPVLQRYFWTVVLLWDRLLEELPFQN